MNTDIMGRQIAPLSRYRRSLEDEARQHVSDYILDETLPYDDEVCDILMLKYLRKKASSLNSSIKRVGKKAVRARHKLIALRKARTVLGEDIYLSLTDQVIRMSKMETRYFESMDEEHKELQLHIIEKTIVMLSRRAERLAMATSGSGQPTPPFQMVE